MKVLCMVTFRRFFSAASLSKSATNRVMSLRLGSCISASTIGFCSLQVGHQSAAKSTMTGLP
jgi:hypothetical protein